MIKSSSEPSHYQTCFTNGSDICVADSEGAYGFRPHELLEAALAAGMNIAIRKLADRLGIPLTAVSVTVALSCAVEGGRRFHHRIDLDGPLSPLQRRRLLLAATQSPECRMLSSGFTFDDEPSTLTGIAASVPPVDRVDVFESPAVALQADAELGQA